MLFKVKVKTQLQQQQQKTTSILFMGNIGKNLLSPIIPKVSKTVLFLFCYFEALLVPIKQREENKKSHLGKFVKLGVKVTPKKWVFGVFLPQCQGKLNSLRVGKIEGPQVYKSTIKVFPPGVPRDQESLSFIYLIKRGSFTRAALAPLQCDFGQPNLGIKSHLGRCIKPWIKDQKSQKFICSKQVI